MSASQWYKLNEDKTVTPLPQGEYPDMAENKHVSYDIVNDAQVSTVFLGLDHGHSNFDFPILFETMIFGGEYSESQWRWYTWHEAKFFHDVIVKALKEKVNPSMAITELYDNRD